MIQKFWSLTGPSRFLAQIIQSAETHGIAGVTIPDSMPAGLLDSIRERLTASGYSKIIHVKSDKTRRPIVHRVAAAAGIHGAALRSIRSLLVASETSSAVFLIDRLDPKDWLEWAIFLRAFRAERERVQGLLLPSLVVVLPVDLPRADVVRIFGRTEIHWRGRVSWLDMRTYVSRVIGFDSPDTLVERIAEATVVELAGYDPDLASFLASHDLGELVSTEGLIAKLTRKECPLPTWSNGLCDEFDGRVFPNTTASLGRFDRKTVERRIWRAHVGTIMRLIDEVREAFCRRYADVLRAAMPYIYVDARGDQQTVDDPRDLELYHLRTLLEGAATAKEIVFLKTINKARNHVAHFETVPSNIIQALSASWDEMRDGLTTDSWAWPRCGQRLTVMIGPTGAGKTTHAKRHHSGDQIVSSDEIRIEKFGSLTIEGPQDAIFDEARRRVVDKLSKGESVVFDATNLRARDRLAVVDLAPVDLEVVYVVIDRPIESKLLLGGWRSEKPNLISAHTDLFLRELPAILKGDGRPNVTVKDVREVSDAPNVA